MSLCYLRSRSPLLIYLFKDEVTEVSFYRKVSVWLSAARNQRWHCRVTCFVGNFLAILLGMGLLLYNFGKYSLVFLMLVVYGYCQALNEGNDPKKGGDTLNFENSYSSSSKKAYSNFHPGQLWFDNQGNHINAHGGGILFHNGKYYWFGEHKGEKSNAAWVGVNCYSSDDLYNWNKEGVALAVDNDVKSPITKGCVIERPKVIFNEKTGKFVMFFHLELKGKGYSAAQVGIASSDAVTGPYNFIRSFRPNAGQWPINLSEHQQRLTAQPADFSKWWTDEWRKAVKDGLFVRRDFAGGQMSRDMTLFVDDDGKAYHIYASEENLTLHLALLSDDYMSHTGKYIRIEPGGHNEAPAIFKKDGCYFMITSGCTGWEPNAARLLVADNIWGPWVLYPNPFVGEDAETTFHSQSTFILPIQGREDAFVFMADRWRPQNPIDGRYIWLPLQFENGLPVLKWLDKWSLEEQY